MIINPPFAIIQRGADKDLCLQEKPISKQGCERQHDHSRDNSNMRVACYMYAK